MEKVKEKYETLIKAQDALKRSIKLYQEKYNSVDEISKEAYVASLIKHFELFYETLWKFLKWYILEKFGIETTGSKTISRAAYQSKIISEPELKLFLDIIEKRNATTHWYDEKAAKEICHTYINYFKEMYPILARIKID